jgi:hypothetical protein
MQRLLILNKLKTKIASCWSYCTDILRCSVNKTVSLKHGFPSRGPPGCITRPAARFVNCAHTMKITQYVRRLGPPLIVILHVRPTNQTTITGVALGRKKLGRPCFEVFRSEGQATIPAAKTLV